jgi:hypothetical protein
MTIAHSPSTQPASLQRKQTTHRSIARSAAAALFSLTILVVPLMISACGGQVEGDVTVQGPPDQVVVTQDEYDYYPAYGVYFNPYRRQYYYQDNGAWINRPGPPGVSVAVLLAPPHARMDFHDHPQYHHDEIIRRYPRTWNQHPGGGHEEHHEERH